MTSAASMASRSKISRREEPDVRMVVVPALIIVVVAALAILSKGLLSMLVGALIGHLCQVGVLLHTVVVITDAVVRLIVRI